MRLVTWNVNGLGSFKFPFNIHTHHTFEYPPVATDLSTNQSGNQAINQSNVGQAKQTSITQAVPDDYDIIDDGSSPVEEAEASSVKPSIDEAVDQSIKQSTPETYDPQSPDFPAFPSTKLVLKPRIINNFNQLIDYFNADILCLQEVKLGRSRRDLLHLFTNVDGYDSFWSFCKKRAGYSGTVTFTRCKTARPIRAEEGISGTMNDQLKNHSVDQEIGCNSKILDSYTPSDIRDLDSEGRCVVTDHGAFVLFNLYVPNAGEQREDFKLRFLEMLNMRVDELRSNGRQVILTGDLNICFTPLDHCSPEPYRASDGSLLPFEASPSRQWLSKQLDQSFNQLTNQSTVSQSTSQSTSQSISQSNSQSNKGEFIDVFRLRYPQQKKPYTVWNTKTNSRSANYGTRIDYFLVTKDIIFPASEQTINQPANRFGSCVDCRILSYVEGSDHCPVQLDLDDHSINQTMEVGLAAPALAASHWADFHGQQKSLKAFFSKAEVIDDDVVSDSDAPVRSNQSNNQSNNRLSESKVSNGELAAVVATPKSNSQFRSPTSNPFQRAPAVKRKTAAPAQSNKRQKAEPAKGKQSLLSFFKPSSSAPVVAKPDVVPTVPLAVNDEAVDLPRIFPAVVTHEIHDLSDENDEPLPISPHTGGTWLDKLNSSAVTTLSCKQHNVPCSRFRVNKKGPNQGREFFCCSLPPPERCSFWCWLADAQKMNKKTDSKQGSSFPSARQIMNKQY